MSRNDENNYTLRPLTIDDAEEYNALLRYAFQVTEQELAETGWKDDAPRLQKRRKNDEKKDKSDGRKTWDYVILIKVRNNVRINAAKGTK